MTTPYPVPLATTEPLGSVTRVLALVEGDGVDAFEGGSLPQLAGRIYGGQVVAQGLLAAAATLEPGPPPAGAPGGPLGPGPQSPVRLPHSVHAYFMRGGKPDSPVRFEVDRMHDGRSFSQRRTTASQNGAPILTMVSSFQVTQEGADVQAQAPDVPGPDELVSALEIFRTIDHPVARFLGRTAAFDLRHVEGNIFLRPGGEVSARQHLWVRSRGAVPAEASQTVHRALLTYVCDQVMLEPALRSQGLSWRSKGMSLATLDHAQWFHRDVDAGDWLLFVQDSPSSQGGRSLARTEVFDSSGTLVSTIAQEGMIRMPTASTAGSGRWAIRPDDDGPAPTH
ncbi:MAG: thioesterase family protein [Actinomyces sp.]|uniref:acyl-CoA thioesterase n=1 Tax=Actinomyces sp. TaxID=29317 RepID=UPI0026DD5AD1|nr:acyl-CoA thioesterase domain-containing protein [Actinomyces sp.]MDO4243201.1 thioesterase family protein [Actinomyces sp.]